MRKIILKLIVCLIVLSLIATNSFVFAKGSNLSVKATASTVKTGETITVTIKNSDMTISSMGAGISFDRNRLQCTSVSQNNKNITVVSTTSEANQSGRVGFAIIGGSDKKYGEGTLVTVKFTAVAAGTAKITLYEDSDGKNGYKSDNAAEMTITISGGGVTVSGYTDVPNGTWYSDAVSYVTKKGYMSGVGDNRFAPSYAVTRATIAQILYARDGKPSGEKVAGFSDVPAGKWFTDAVNWCASKGIVAGYNKDCFGPNDPITRQQLATMLYQYAKLKGYDNAANGDLNKFKDSKDVSAYAVTPLKWAVGHGIISGTDKGLEPKGTATRAQIAVILQAFDKNIK